MEDRIIIKGFYSTDSATHTYNIPTPQKPIGFDYANRNIEVEDETSVSGFDMDVTNIAFINSKA